MHDELSIEIFLRYRNVCIFSTRNYTNRNCMTFKIYKTVILNRSQFCKYVKFIFVIQIVLGKEGRMKIQMDYFDNIFQRALILRKYLLKN